MRHIWSVISAVGLLQASLLAQSTEPATKISLPEGPLQITITGILGKVQARSSPDKEWETATIGMQLSEGAELRTGPKSSVSFHIGPDQTFTIDRFTAIQILKANFESGKVFTDVGMKYGRTRYDGARWIEHDARKAAITLRVRGCRYRQREHQHGD